MIDHFSIPERMMIFALVIVLLLCQLISSIMFLLPSRLAGPLRPGTSDCLAYISDTAAPNFPTAQILVLSAPFLSGMF